MTEVGCQRYVRLVLSALCLMLVGCAATHRARTEPPAELLRESVDPSASASSGQTPQPGPAAQTARREEASPDWTHDTWAELEVRLRRDIFLSLDDYRHYYSPGNLAWVALGIGGMAAPLANTPADRSVRDWYQRRAEGGTLDRFAEVVNVSGQLWVVWPVCVEMMALAGWGDHDYCLDGGLREWSNRSLRALAVGFPPVVLLYGLLGSGRPDREDSRWRPFNDIRGVSGHTFTGAIPFLTAAAMTDNPLLKSALFAGSFATGWSRLHKDRHYLSQIALGWWLAFFAVRSVDTTQDVWKSLSLVPLTSEGPGLGVLIQY